MSHGDQTNYDAIAEIYLGATDEKPFVSHYERPYMLRHLPDLTGKTVLDLGCGTGFYSHFALGKGARVISVDASERMIEHTNLRCGGKNEFFVHDLAEPFFFVGDSSVDVVICSLVFHYIERWDPVLAEIYRTLKPGGLCLVSTHHPVNDYVHSGESGYFETRMIEDLWRGFSPPITVKYFVRPLSEYLRPFLHSDFTIRKIDEPMPTPELEQSEPGMYDRLSERPTFLFFVLEKEGER
jgi:SAM-dependent methyltransferase